MGWIHKVHILQVYMQCFLLPGLGLHIGRIRFMVGLVLFCLGL